MAYSTLEKRRQQHRNYRQQNLEKCRAWTRNWYHRNATEINRKRKAKRGTTTEKTWAKTHGLTRKQFVLLSRTLDGKCMICQLKKSLCADHNHQTLQFRELLCNDCNRALGLFKDSLVTLQSAICYLNGLGPLNRPPA
jgi:hypothetical protein